VTLKEIWRKAWCMISVKQAEAIITGLALICKGVFVNTKRNIYCVGLLDI